MVNVTQHDMVTAALVVVVQFRKMLHSPAPLMHLWRPCGSCDNFREAVHAHDLFHVGAHFMEFSISLVNGEIPLAGMLHNGPEDESHMREEFEIFVVSNIF